MSHAKILLGAVGIEDEKITNNAKQTYFKYNYKTHTKFASNWTSVINNNKPNPNDNTTKFPPNSSVYFRLPIQGDILLDTILRFKLYDVDANNGMKNQFLNITEHNKGIGEFTSLSLIKKIQFLNNDKIISELDKIFIANFMKLSLENDKYQNYRKLSSFDNNSSVKDKYMPKDGKFVRYVSLPLPFWFTKSEGLGFPMWALTDPNIGMKIILDDYQNVNNNNTCNIFDIEILAKYAYLDMSEKEKFKNIPLEYNIEQLEIVDKISINNNTNFSKKINLPSTHFIKYIMWNLTENDKLGFNGDKFEFDSCDGITDISLNINGNQVISDLNNNVTRLINRHRFFKSPRTNIDLDYNVKGSNDLNLHTYSFCLQPLSYQSSGFFTTEKFNQSVLSIKGITPNSNSNNIFTLNIYLVKQNIIRFKNGKMDILFN